MTASGKQVTAVFRDVDAFKDALRALVAAGFEPHAISVLAPHDLVESHFGGDVPMPEVLEEDAGTPRERLDLQERLHATIHALGEFVGSVVMVAAAGAAYAVGGPVGTAAMAGDSTENTVESTLDGFVDAAYTERFKDTLADGGLVCWVAAATDDAEAKAAALLGGAGGDHVHTVTLG
jgi:hypothetical protein